ncbi:MAG: hypothetical protein IPJ19_01030 [Planctomycetes bacterium]|nr:hypothetical protein [Planctomycetota bacterium]
MSTINWKHALALGAALPFFAAAANAQSLASTSGNLVATDGWNAPGLPGVTFGGSGNFDIPVIDANGTLLFRSRLIGTSGPMTERALFYGTTYANLAVLVQSGDPAPTLAGVTLNTASGQGLGGSPRMSANGLTFWCSSMSGAVTTSDDTAIFGGAPGSLGILVREGDVMPGTTGATLTTSFSNLSQQPTGMQSGGRMLFQGSLAGGDVSGTTNNTGWITGTPGNLEFAIRKGDTVLGGAVVSALGFISQMNDSGQVLHEETLSQTLGSNPATASNDKVLFVFTPGAGNSVVVREGDAAPGTVGATFNIASNSWSVNTGACTFNRNGDTIISADLLNGDVIATINDRGVYVGGTSGLQLAVRRGDAAPGTDGNIDTVNNTSQCLNNAGQIAFEATIVGGTATTADDSGIWAGSIGALQLVAREGDPAPGTSAGELIGQTTGWQEMMNDLGQVLFNNSLTGAAAGTSSALYAWTPGLGLTLVIRGGDQIETSPGVFKDVGSFGGSQFNNGDSAGLSFSHLGVVALKVTFTDGTGGILTVQLPVPSGVNFCTPGAGGVASCPCSNPPASGGRGCDNSSATGGASVSPSGVPSLFGDTLSFTTAGEKPTAASILLSGTTTIAGSVFGQGIRCANGVLKRLYLHNASGGSVSFPGVGDPSVSARHLANGDPLSGGMHRYYQVYYRDPIVLGGCVPTSTYNATDAVDVLWLP